MTYLEGYKIHLTILLMGGKAKAGNFPALFLLVMQSAELHSAISRETTGLV